MKKKVLATLLSATMVASLAVGCGSSTETTTTEEAATESTEAAADTAEEAASEATEETTEEAAADTAEAAPVEAEELPEAFAHYTFDEGADEGYTAVVRTDDIGDNDGATYGIADAGDYTFQYADGAVGQALYVDGETGVNLNLEPTNTDSYTVSFWMNADRLATYGPTLQFGYNMGKAADAGNDVTWANFTQSEWGENSAKVFPIVWSRNESSDAADGTDCWPWLYAFDNEIHGKREWVQVTLVCSGEEQTGATGATTVGAQYYINGQLVYDSQDNYENGTYFEYTWDATLAPNIMQPGDNTFESYFGINYWDTIYKGFVDDLYVFDTALTAGQVVSLYEMGDPTVETVAPEDGASDAASTEASAEGIDNSAVETTGTVVGETDCSTGFWTAFSDVVEVPSGESVTVNFKNYTDGLNNWDNFLVVLQNVADAHSADENADYKEYAVVRADNYGWGTGYDNIATAECDWNWDTFVTDINGADVELTITNNGDTADVVAVVTTADGATYNQSYTGIAVDGDLYYCLSVEKGFLDVQ